MSLDPELVKTLVCPATRTPLRYDEASQELISDEAGVAYPVRDGTPILLIEEARIMDEAAPRSSTLGGAAADRPIRRGLRP